MLRPEDTFFTHLYKSRNMVLTRNGLQYTCRAAKDGKSYVHVSTSPAVAVLTVAYLMDGGDFVFAETEHE